MRYVVHPAEPEHPREALWEQVEVIWDNYSMILDRHKTACVGEGTKRLAGSKAGTYTGCPGCHKITGDPFIGWRLRVELDWLCAGNEALLLPEFPDAEIGEGP